MSGNLGNALRFRDKSCRFLTILLLLMLVLNLIALLVTLSPNVKAEAFLTIEKTVDKQYTYPGEYLNYTIYFNNTGDKNSSYVLINETLPEQVIYNSDNASNLSIFETSWNDNNSYYFEFLNVTSHENYSFWINVTVNSTTPDSAKLINNVTLNWTNSIGEFQPVLLANAKTTVIAPNITVVKTVDKAEAIPGDILNYTIYFNNTGSGIASYVWINDTLPPHTKYVSDNNWTIVGMKTGDYNWTFTDISPGNYSFNLWARILPSAPFLTPLINCVDLEYTALNGNYIGMSTDYAYTLVPPVPSISVGILVDKSKATRNEVLNYTVLYNNLGEVSATYVWINATLSKNLSFIGSSDIYNSPDGQTYEWVFTNVIPGFHFMWFTATVNSSVANGEQLTTVVELNYTDGIHRFEGSNDSATTTVAFPVFGPLSIAADSLIVHPGDIITYNITFSNVKLGVASYVWINYTYNSSEITYLSDTSNTVPFFSGNSTTENKLMYVFQDVPNGIYSFDIIFKVSEACDEGTQILTKAKLEFTDVINNFYPPVEGLLQLPVHRPIISVKAEANKTVAMVGDEISYTIYFNNTGGSNATTVWINFAASELTYVSDDAPFTGLYLDSTIAPGMWEWIFANVTPGIHYFNIEATVNSGFIDGDIVTVDVFCDYRHNEVQFESSADWAEVSIRGQPYIEFSVTVDKTEATPGMPFTYNVHFDNLGNAVASFAWINLSIPQGLSYVGDTSSSVSGVSSAKRLAIGYWLFEDVSMGKHSFTIFIKGEHEIPDGLELTSYFSLDYTDYYNTNYNPVQTTAKTEFKRPVIEVSVNVSETFPERGELIVFTIHLNNTGSVKAGWVRVEFLTTALIYVMDDAESINGIKLGDFSFLFTEMEKGSYSFNVRAAVDFETSAGFINSTLVISYTDPSGTIKWNTTKTVVLTLDILIPAMITQEPLNAFPLLVAVIVMLGLGSIFLSENSKYAFFTLFLPLYAKLRKKNILEHETRGLIRGYIIANPGDHFNSIKKALELNNGTLAYHLHVLKREGMIKSRRWGKFTRFYPCGMKVPENGSRYSEIQKLIINKIKETPGISQKDIAKIIGVTKPTINYHISKLMEGGRIEGRRLGIQIRYFLREEAKKFNS